MPGYIDCRTHDDRFLDENEVVDMLDEFPDAVKAERKGSNTLILRRLEDHEYDYELTYWWHERLTSAPRQVLGTEVSYWNGGEIDFNKGLFAQFNLF